LPSIVLMFMIIRLPDRCQPNLAGWVKPGVRRLWRWCFYQNGWHFNLLILMVLMLFL